MSSFGGLVVSMLVSGTQDRGSDFSGEKILSMPPSEGKLNRLPYVADLWHVKEPYNLPCKSQIIG
jgi:hypothetical protein